MPFIDGTYFIGDLDIPNTDKDYVAERIDWCINQYEPEFLQKILGYALYKAFVNGVNISTTTPADPDETENTSEDESTVNADQRWLDLRDGVEYTDLVGELRRWKGLIITDKKSSFIANYVYYWYRRGTATQTTGIGEVAANAENSVNVPPVQKMVTAWNKMVDWIKELVAFLDAKVETYPEWKNVSHWLTFNGVRYYRNCSYDTFIYLNPFDI